MQRRLVAGGPLGADRDWAWSGPLRTLAVVPSSRCRRRAPRGAGGARPGDRRGAGRLRRVGLVGRRADDLLRGPGPTRPETSPSGACPLRAGRPGPWCGSMTPPTGGTGPPAFGCGAAASTSTSATSRATSGWRRSRAHDEGDLGPPPVGAGGPLHDRARARPRRHGYDLSRVRSPPRPRRGAQSDAPRGRRRARPRAIPAGDPHQCSARSPAHPHPDRLGPDRWRAVVRPALRAGRVPAG